MSNFKPGRAQCKVIECSNVTVVWSRTLGDSNKWYSLGIMSMSWFRMGKKTKTKKERSASKREQTGVP
jgi:hypothetical protein